MNATPTARAGREIQGHKSTKYASARAPRYIKYFTGLTDVPVIPNYCGYTNAHYAPKRPQLLVGPGRGVHEGLCVGVVGYRVALDGRQCCVWFREGAPPSTVE